MKRYVKQFPNLNLHGRFLIFDKKKGCAREEGRRRRVLQLEREE